MRHFIELSYHGADFHGWQIQPNARTVQGELIHALSTLLREDIQVLGCGRTDTGVHASYFLAQFDTQQQPDCSQLKFKLNKMIRYRMSVRKIWPADADVNVRFDATYRTYKYYINTVKDPFRTDQSYYVSIPLDIELMNQACLQLFNYSDFTSFSRLHTDVKTNNCEIMHAKWEQKDSLLIFTIQANRFLRNMVRAIVGTLLEVGKKKMTIEAFCSVIETKNRSAAGTSAPAHGLFLVDVGYPEGYL